MVSLVPKLISSSLEALKFSSKLLILIGVIIVTVESGILSLDTLDTFLKLKSIITRFLENKSNKSKKSYTNNANYTNLPIPDDLPFEIRVNQVNPESKTIITMPNWIKTAIPVFKFGYKRFQKQQPQNKSGKTDQNDYNLIKELIELSELQTETKGEKFDIDLEDIKNLIEDFMD